MKEKKSYRKVRVIDPKHKNFGKVIEVYKMEDSRFFANRWGAKYGDCAYFSDQLSFSPYEPIPVMYVLGIDERGPWILGYIHPDDIKKVTPKNEDEKYVKVNRKNFTELEVYDMHDGVPAIPGLVAPFDSFTPPTWSPAWNWNVYCENRNNPKKAE